MLRDKLGIQEGTRVAILNAPRTYRMLLGSLPRNVERIAIVKGHADFVQFFTTSREELADCFPHLKRGLAPAGMLWICWPKTARSTGQLNEASVRSLGLKHGLLDVKAISIDDTWCGLKFIYRPKDRKS